ncbi:hypothetical protein WP12_12245 [Sphingomonas sp. SRS2]|nr:hypothetical protein WP12_12245 [Sphingomonas sp. SRS2]
MTAGMELYGFRAVEPLYRPAGLGAALTLALEARRGETRSGSIGEADDIATAQPERPNTPPTQPIGRKRS